MKKQEFNSKKKYNMIQKYTTTMKILSWFTAISMVFFAVYISLNVYTSEKNYNKMIQNGILFLK